MKQIAILTIVLVIYSCNTSNEKTINNHIEKIEDIKGEVASKEQQDKKDVKQITDTLISTIEQERCNCVWDTVDAKAEWFKTLTELTTDINEIPENINEFYNNFVSDSISQPQKVDFDEFLGLIGECDTTIRLNLSNWEYIKFDYKEFVEDKKLDMTYYYSEDKFYYEVYLVEIGVMYQFGFELKEDEWRLTLFSLNVC